MFKDTLTLSLSGDIPLDLFVDVMGHFNKLVQNLSDEVSGSGVIEWEIAHLEGGSAVATVRGIAQNESEVEKVVRAYGIVGQSLSEGKEIPYSENVANSAYAITSVLNGQITAVQFITDEIEASVSEPVIPDEAQGFSLYSLGVISGVVDAIWNRPLRLGIYDSLFNRSVHCYLDDDQHEKAREVWGKHVSVTGMIKRDFETGRPIEVRQVKNIDIQEDFPKYSFKKAKGAISWQDGDEPAETIIRRIRDGIE